MIDHILRLLWFCWPENREPWCDAIPGIVVATPRHIWRCQGWHRSITWWVEASYHGNDEHFGALAYPVGFINEQKGLLRHEHKALYGDVSNHEIPISPSPPASPLLFRRSRSQEHPGFRSNSALENSTDGVEMRRIPPSHHNLVHGHGAQTLETLPTGEAFEESA